VQPFRNLIWITTCISISISGYRHVFRGNTVFALGFSNVEHFIATTQTDRQTISFIEFSIEAGILLGGKHEACSVLGVAGIEPMPS
jgi:hypothetical protein